MRDFFARHHATLALMAVMLCASAAMHSFTAWSRARLGAAVAENARAGDIHMLASVTCVYCAEARAWFHAHRVPFTECLIENDTRCADSYRALMSPGTPVMLVRGRPLVGFSAQAVADALATRSQ